MDNGEPFWTNIDAETRLCLRMHLRSLSPEYSLCSAIDCKWRSCLESSLPAPWPYTTTPFILLRHRCCININLPERVEEAPTSGTRWPNSFSEVDNNPEEGERRKQQNKCPPCYLNQHSIISITHTAQHFFYCWRVSYWFSEWSTLCDVDADCILIIGATLWQKYCCQLP